MAYINDIQRCIVKFYRYCRPDGLTRLRALGVSFQNVIAVKRYQMSFHL